jgi:hypothetical protein
MQETSTIGYDDIVEMTDDDQINDEVVVEVEDELEKFETWIMGLGEESAITSQDEEEQSQAIKDLQELVGQHFPAGVDGSNAIESLKGIIDDPALFKQIKEVSKEDPDTCVRPIVKDWLDQNAPEIVDQLDFGDMVDQSAEPQAETDPAAAGEEEPQMADMDQDSSKKNMSVQELAEFINSFYDKESGTFPKGPEGVCTMVGKKFGEQAEQVARKFVERMAPHQSTEQNPELAELARVRELAGVGESVPAKNQDVMINDVERMKALSGIAQGIMM